jgi:hypothetical protein
MATIQNDWPVITVDGNTGHWSNAREPKIGDRVRIKFNQFGTGTILATFVEEGWLGVIVKCDKRPQWHIKQNGDRHPNPHVFGAEVEFLD